VLAVALLSPLDELGDHLASAHMVQHLLLALVAPLLIVRARAGRTLGHLIDPALRRRTGRMIGRATRSTALLAAAVVAYVAVWWSWHLPVLYDAALADDRIHLVEHECLFGAGLALWTLVWPGGPVRQRGGLAVLALFVAAFATGPLAAILTLSRHAYYATDAGTAAAWGLSRVTDQQLGGAIMWVPGGFIYLGAGVAMFAAWLDRRPPRDPGLTPDRVVIVER
jgi:cytochrome c oxidase assembly factor CtaG